MNNEQFLQIFLEVLRKDAIFLEDLSLALDNIFWAVFSGEETKIANGSSVLHEHVCDLFSPEIAGILVNYVARWVYRDKTDVIHWTDNQIINYVLSIQTENLDETEND